MPNTARKIFAVAPMMEWTDRHCRMFHRQYTAHALLFTEMINAAGLVKGGADWLLAHDPREHPLALQLGGSEPEMLFRAVEMARPLGFCEVNLNVGCPSDRVQSGSFGACLMREPALVAECCRAMIEAAGGGPEITVKCRIGVDEQDPEAVLPDFLSRMEAAGVRQVMVHARKAWLKGLSPKENRTIPPLDYDLVLRVKHAFSNLTISLNGGIATLEEAAVHLREFDGVMIGRAAYHDPTGLLAGVDNLLTGEDRRVTTAEEAVRGMFPYIAAELAKGTRLHQITRHMLSAFNGRRGARAWRQVLSNGATKPGAGVGLVERAMAEIAAPVAAE